jgi:hypothetical protein
VGSPQVAFAVAVGFNVHQDRVDKLTNKLKEGEQLKFYITHYAFVRFKASYHPLTSCASYCYYCKVVLWVRVC